MSTPRKVNRNSKGAGGFKSPFFLNFFLEGLGFKVKKTSMGSPGTDIFWNNTIQQYHTVLTIQYNIFISFFIILNLSNKTSQYDLADASTFN